MGSEYLTIDPATSQESRVTMKITPVRFTKEKLKQFWDDMPQKKKELCSSKFGRLHEFIDFDTNWDMIRALLWFWDPSRRCFVINGEDCTPTIEEF